MSTGALPATTEAVEALQALIAADLSSAERDELAELVHHVRKVRGFVDAFDVQIARRGRELNERDRPRPTPAPDAAPPRPDRDRDEASLISMLLSAGCQSGKDAKATSTREAVCADLPDFEQALAAGEISGAHVDVLGRALRGLTEVEKVELRDRSGELLSQARIEFAEGYEKTVRNMVNEIRSRHRPNSDAEELERQHAMSKITTWVDQPTGMCKTLIELDPLRHDEWSRAMAAHLTRLKDEPASRNKSFQQLKVEAFIAAVQPPATSSHSSDGRPDGRSTTPVRVPKALVVIDLHTLLHGPHAATIAELSNGTPLPVSTIRRLLCEADIVPVVLSGDGQPLDLGRSRRLASPAQRDALRAIYSTCAEPGCTVPFDDCAIHHTKPWDPGGNTDIALLAPLCAGGHTRVHDGGWNLTIDDNHRSMTWTRPDGTIEYHGPAGNRRKAA